MGNRINNKMDMTISEQLDYIADQVCYEYCRYYEQMENGVIKKKILKDCYCKNCPLKEI